MTNGRTFDSTNPPDFLTVEEAADVVRIGRTAAYRLARQYLATSGTAGLPVVRYGKQLRVPRVKLGRHSAARSLGPFGERNPNPSSSPGVLVSHRSAARGKPFKPRVSSRRSRP